MTLQIMANEGSECILQNLPVPAVLGECIFDETGQPVDYRFISANAYFEERMESSFPTFRGHTVREIFPYMEDDPFDRIRFVGTAVAEGMEKAQTMFYSQSWQRWVHLIVYPLASNRFLALYPDTAEVNGLVEKLTKIIVSLKDILTEEGQELDYGHITRVLQEIVNCKVAVFNLIREDESASETVAMAAEVEILATVEGCLGHEGIGKVWDMKIPVQMPATDELLRCYPHLSDFTEEPDLKKKLQLIEEEASLGETVVARVNVGERTIGYFVFCQPRGIPFQDEALVNIFSRYVAMAFEVKRREQEIVEKGQQYQLLFENMGSGANVFEVINEGRSTKDYLVRDCNPASLRYNGRSREEAMGCSLCDLNPSMEENGFADFLRQVWLTGKTDYRLSRVVRANGQIRWYESRAFRLPNGYVSTLFNNVSDRVLAEQEQAESEQNLSQLVENMGQGLAVLTMIYDEEGLAVDCRYQRVNLSFERMTGLQGEEIIGKTIKEVLPDFDDDWIQLYNQVASRGETLEFEEYFTRFNAYYHVVAYRPYEGAFAVILTDITERKQAEKELVYRSNYDHLTGLYNRHYFDETIQKMDQPDRFPLALILADLDDLKMINDIFGHQEGDRAIRMTADIMKQACPAESVLARTGGDEFSILLPDSDEPAAYNLIQKIEHALDECQGAAGTMSLSIGYAVKRSEKQSFGELFKKAEDMMYRNKLMWKSRSTIGTVDMIMQALREKNPREAVHADQVAIICQEIGKAMNLSWDSLRETVTAAMMHDIGKIGVPDRILEKPGKLTQEEYKMIQKHCQSGYKILKPIPQLNTVAETVLAHHERWDGQGYPYRITGEKIPLHARIIAVADTVAAIISERPYRPARDLDAAAVEIKRCSGTQFDPIIVQAFLMSLETIREKLCSHLQG